MISKVQVIFTFACISSTIFLKYSYCLSAIPSDEQLYQRSSDQLNQLFSPNSIVNTISNQNHVQDHNIPGHYEFELAPKMTPPVVRKPPYKQTQQLCAGSNPFASFSPRDTLCGDLNQGRVPQNPIGQNVLDQSYPFELIANKTLQFLAKALPVLKNEYETIPKVARFVQQAPAQHLLNPTNEASPLTSEHFNQLNQHLAMANGFSIDDLLNLQQQRRKRKRRSASRSPSHEVDGSVSTVAELAPNATLVVSSAHSGRIGSLGNPMRQTGAGGNESSLHMITKNGYKPIQQSYQFKVSQKTPAASVSAVGPTLSATATSAQLVVSSQVPERSDHGQSIATPQSSDGHQQQASNGRSAHVASSSGRAEGTAETNKQISSRSSELIIGSRAKSNNGGGGTTAAGSGSASQQQPVAQQVQAQAQTQTPRQPGELAAKRPRNACSEVGNGFTSVICQAASSLIEGEKLPAWLQLAKSIGKIYASPQEENTLASLFGLATSAGDSPKNAHQQSKANFLDSIINSVASHLIGGPSISSKSDPSGSEIKETNQNALSLLSSSLTKVALTGWAANTLANLYDYFVPMVFHQSTNSRSFAKRKKPFDPQETFVDTPASLAASASGLPISPNGMKSFQGAGSSKQPPLTPCPSVEEYISPTFARNYQGAWKYVVQIPHENYFTQTIQRTSCVRQKCEFTDGTCHESPRWVSLLVAEIYYPYVVYSSNKQLSEQHQLTAAPSTSSIQQMAMQQDQQQQLHNIQAKQSVSPQGDPLQMTDSSSTYNHNLNNAFISVANDLGLDPNNVANMQHLANAYNYQLMQRDGLLSSQTSSGPESRASQNYVPTPTRREALIQQQQQPHQPIGGGMNNNQLASPATLGQQVSVLNNEYVAALATQILRQNPGMTLEELIRIWQSQLTRKRRDLQAINRRQYTSNNQQITMPQDPAQLKASLDSLASLNDISSPSSNLPQANNFKPIDQQQQPQAAASNLAANMPNQQQQANNKIEGQQQTDSPNQQECDGHDKIGCYVVRVYYDWFLVNGSCKCWKTTSNGANSNGPSSSSSGNSFLRRIFTG